MIAGLGQDLDSDAVPVHVGNPLLAEVDDLGSDISDHSRHVLVIADAGCRWCRSR